MSAFIMLLCLSIDVAPAAPRFERLDNGLNVVVVEDHALPAVSVQLWRLTGQAGDPPGRPGLCAAAHRAMELYDPPTGVPDVRLYTCENRTLSDACYYAWVSPPGAIDAALVRAARLLAPLSLTPADVKRAVGAAARDYDRRGNSADEKFMRLVRATMFAGHAYQRSPGFVARSAADLSPEEVQAFVRRCFMPSNAVLFFIGDVSTETVLGAVRRRFGGIEAAPPPVLKAVARMPAAQLRAYSSDVPNTCLVMAWRTLPLGYFDNAATDVLMQRLCNPIDGPLYRRLAGLGCAQPRWRRGAWRDAGMLVLLIDASAAATKFDDIEAAVHEEIQRAGMTIPAEIEHCRARALARRQLLENREHFHERAVNLAEYHAVAGDLLLAGYAVSRIDAVGVRDVQEAAVGLTDAQTVILRPVDADHPASQPALEPPLSVPAGEDSPTFATDESYEVAETIERDLGDGLRLIVHRTPGRGLAEVRTVALCDNLPDADRDDWREARTERLSAGQLRDYLSYHGLDLALLRVSADAESPRCLRSRGPAAGLSRMIELHAQVLRHVAAETPSDADRIRPPRIVIAGDVVVEEALAAVRAVWGE